jgi:hypothetical protein
VLAADSQLSLAFTARNFQRGNDAIGPIESNRSTATVAPRRHFPDPICSG